MYEFKHFPVPVLGKDILVENFFDFESLSRLAIIRFIECPKFVTLARHTNLEEITPIHCVAARTMRQVDLLVPRQNLFCKTGVGGYRFIILKVITENGHACWLVVCEQYRQGFLLRINVLNRYGNRVSSRNRSIRNYRHWNKPKQ